MFRDMGKASNIQPRCYRAQPSLYLHLPPCRRARPHCAAAFAPAGRISPSTAA
jgi:hypothetical protein